MDQFAARPVRQLHRRKVEQVVLYGVVVIRPEVLPGVGGHNFDGSASRRPRDVVGVGSRLEELAALDIAPSVVFVFENLETMFAIPELLAGVVTHGGGYAAPRLSRIPWIHSGRIICWGDLDSDGFAILHALRSCCAEVTSVLMDEETLLAYRDLWVPEPKAAGGTYSSLTAGELGTLEPIRAEGNARLEQERIAWEFALTQLVMAATATRLAAR